MPRTNLSEARVKLLAQWRKMGGEPKPNLEEMTKLLKTGAKRGMYAARATGHRISWENEKGSVRQLKKVEQRWAYTSQGCETMSYIDIRYSCQGASIKDLGGYGRKRGGDVVAPSVISIAQNT